MGVHVPLLTLSVDLEPEIEQQRDGSERQLEEITAELIRLFEQYQIATTWAVADPAISAAMHLLRRSKLPHEVAIQGERSWVGHGAGRLRFARELSRRVLSAQSAGIEVTTLALKNAILGEHLDLLVKSGITVVRGGKSVVTDTPTRQPTLRFGVCEAPIALRLPERSRWSWSAGSWSAKRLIRNAVRKQVATHLVIDAAGLLGANSAMLVTIDRLLGFAAWYRDHGQLEIAPLHRLAQDSRAMNTQPMRSILRPAA